MRYLAVAALLALLAVLIAPIASLGAEEEDDARLVEATVYFYGWEMETRARLTLEQVRKSSRMTTTILDEGLATRFGELLRLREMVARTDEVVNADPRLVIDMRRRDGKMETYFASWSHLFSADGRRLRKIDARFRARFLAILSGEATGTAP
jgi:hypothetical protein